ncbi:hypothetical protein I3760_06G000400 [Carya illinoinensis]|nr:hypothetical protein I3760_06G000400 [Carya illinoinensis]
MCLININDLADFMGCRVSSLPMNYLGLPLGASFMAKHIWDGLVEIIEKRLAAWKRMYLSKGGRITHIKSTLSNIPMYFLSLFPLLVGVANRIEKLFRDFLWGGLGEENKIPLVNWKKVCCPLDVGGLGVRNFCSFNKALLGKWLWRFNKEEGALWRGVIARKYGTDRGGCCTKVSRGTYGVSLWRFLRKGWDDFVKQVYFVVGDGLRIHFWFDVWCGETALFRVFPNVFRLAANQQDFISELMSFLNDEVYWNVNFIRSVQDWEIEEVTDFF